MSKKQDDEWSDDDAARRMDELIERTKHWDPRDQERAARELAKIRDTKIEHWYCNLARKCDGKPHEGYPYKHARADQWPPPGTDWFVWFIMSGRGTGKTRSGANWVRKMSKYTGRIALVGRRGPDVRQTMIEGPSGLVRTCELAGERYDWKPALKEFTFENGAKAFGYSGEEPDTLRGPEHGAAWLDEPSHMPLIKDVYSNLLLGLRVPGVPGGAKILCTSTPLPNEWTKEISARGSTRLIRVPTSINIENLDRAYLENVIGMWDGTRLGRQELEGMILEDVEGSLWKNDMIVRRQVNFEDMERIVIGVDPAGTANRRSDETGIVIVGRKGREGYVLHDATDKYSPQGWAEKIDRLYRDYKADAVVVETNFGGDMVKQNLTQFGSAARIMEKRATRGKDVRAEPVVGLYEQKRMFHVDGLAKLENEMTTWVPNVGASPNRVDALVWATMELFQNHGESTFVSPRSLNPIGGPDWSRLNPIEALRRSRKAS